MASSELEPVTTAIRTATVERLQDMLVSLTAADKHVREAVERALLVPVDSPTIKRDGAPPLSQVRVDAPAAAKRKRYEVCDQCRKEFDTTHNPDDACVWHDGYMEADYLSSRWADHDEDCHGTIESEEMREQYPDGYVWDCCEKRGDEEGCQITKHTADASFTAVKRRR